MEKLLALLKWIISTLVRRTFVFLFALTLAALGMVSYLLVKVVVLFNQKQEEHAAELKAATDRTISAQEHTILLQDKEIIRTKKNKTHENDSSD